MESPAVRSLKRYKNILWTIFFVLCLYCFVDIYQTKMLFDLGAYELNPFLKWLMDVTGTWWSILIFKYIVLVFLGYWLNKYQIAYRKVVNQIGGTQKWKEITN